MPVSSGSSVEEVCNAFNQAAAAEASLFLSYRPRVGTDNSIITPSPAQAFRALVSV